ncbi:TetR family transcriptional regulator [Corynebacterium uberis]|uniref:TetR family transcriptional regulator n=1 Tax=Corynebacterium TaxID=1716 RepID=UPI001D0B97A9|nr:MULTISPECIES: TetR family transcriptional regulator [Corynebacterium]MCZ9310143.1 TetR family transcriptional regulator [Corynebacterium sp. c6VSa_13]UDL73284.1 TetR family transcriptional regulator [Corynebacterium uberis]UDL75838.1 TetR family transcriptional regulator [Corynebacterium uberis]UDL78051.1 TetR family transcriptional regulator [Corynebacterium uberis]UDL80333.1 TetR family transcriptional regulator [Corynebacterium uberis]
MTGLSFDDLVTIADAVCAHTGARVRTYADLAACAAATTARLRGVPVHRDVDSQATCLRRQILALRPLDADNDLMATVATNVLRDLYEPATR